MREFRMTLDLVPERSENAMSFQLRSGKSWREAGDTICDVFGGYTVMFTAGCWKPERYGLDKVYDPSITFMVATHYADYTRFKQLAVELAQGQDTVYVCGPWGEPEILPVGKVVDVVPTTEPASDVFVFHPAKEEYTRRKTVE